MFSSVGVTAGNYLADSYYGEDVWSLRLWDAHKNHLGHSAHDMDILYVKPPKNVCNI